MEKINIAELLKDCPQGMELDCTMFRNLEFDRIEEYDGKCVIICRVKTGIGYNIHTFTEQGCYSEHKYAKCVIFPKGKTTWEGFQRPFKDGDVLAFDDNIIVIFKDFYNKKTFHSYCHIEDGVFSISKVDCPDWWNGEGFKPATKEQRAFLFQKMKEAGYGWNSETKTLERLIVPKFKVGDWVTDGISKCQVHFIDDTQYWYSENCILGSIESVDKQYHLWTIKDAKDGDVIFYDYGWTCIFKCIHGIWYSSYCFTTYDGEFHTGCVRHAVDSTINGNVHPATKEQCNLLFQKIKEAGYEWNAETRTLERLIKPEFKVGDVIQDIDSYKVKITEVNIEDECYGYESVISKGIGGIGFNEQDNWKLVPNKFDINTLKPLQPVLVRNTNGQAWTVDLFSHKIDTNKRLQISFVCVGHCPNQCIPYEGNEHLLGTTNDCDEFYKTWEE